MVLLLLSEDQWTLQSPALWQSSVENLARKVRSLDDEF